MTLTIHINWSCTLFFIFCIIPLDQHTRHIVYLLQSATPKMLLHMSSKQIRVSVWHGYNRHDEKRDRGKGYSSSAIH